MACKYIYKGNEYTRGQILDQIMKGGLSLQVLDQQKARETIKRITGMTDAQIEFIKGLIDGKALGRMLSDGRILLSEMASESTAYHEAFHRVWQGSLTSEERNAAIREFKTNKNWERLIEPYRASYGDDVDVRIEEYFADEFANFVLGEPTPKTFLQKLFAQLKKMLDYLGLTKPSEIERIYDLMNKGAYASRPIYSPFKVSNSILVNLMEEDGESRPVIIDSQDYTSVLEMLHRETIGDMIKDKGLIKFTNDPNNYTINIKESDIAERVLQEISDSNNGFEETIENWDEASQEDKDRYEKFLAMEQDMFYEDGTLKPKEKSQILTLYDEYKKGFKFKLSYVKEDVSDSMSNDVQKDQSTQEYQDASEIKSEEQQNSQGPGEGYDKSSFEFDPNSRMSQQVRLLLSSIKNPKDISTMGTPRSYNWVDFANFLNESLIGVPSTNEDFMERLKDLKQNRYYGSGVEELIEHLGGEELDITNPENNEYIELRTKMINHFARTRYTFQISLLTPSKLKTIDATTKAKKDAIKNRLSSYFVGEIGNAKSIMDFKNKIAELVKSHNQEKNNEEKRNIKRRIVESFNLMEFYDSLQDNADKVTFVSKLMGIAETISKMDETDTNENLITLFIDPRSSDVFKYVSDMVDLVAKANRVTELSILDAVGNKVYGVALASYQSQVLDEINYHLSNLEKDMSLDAQDKINYLFEKMPQLNNFATRNSNWLRTIVEKKGRLVLVVNNGVNTENSGIKSEMSDLGETALLSVYINQLLEDTAARTWQTVKHSDRSVLYGIQIKGADGSNLGTLAVNDPSKEGFREEVKDALLPFLIAETEKYKAIMNGELNDIQHIGNTTAKKMFFGERTTSKGEVMSVLTDEDYHGLIQHMDDMNHSVWTEALDKIADMAEDIAVIDHDYITEWGVYNMNEVVENDQLKRLPVGVSEEIFNKYMKEAEKNYPNKSKVEQEKTALYYISRLYSVNSMIGYLEQSMLITGDPNLYKSAADAFKRFGVFSSTGDLSVTGAMTREYIKQKEDATKFIKNGKEVAYHEMEFSQDPDFISSHSYAEEDYAVDKKTISYYENRAKENLLELAENIGYSKEEAEQIAKKHSESLAKAYAETNEPDGQSWMNFFEWRRTKIRWGQWTEAHERLFEKELAIFNGQDSFVIPESVEDAQVYFNEFLGLAETIKGQYAGPYWTNTNRVNDNDFNVQGVGKTSFYVMLPSQIRGTKLEKLNRHTVNNGMGVIHVASARKFGQRLVLDENGKPRNDKNYVKGLPKAYNADGDINLDVDYKLANQYMEAKYFKHQVKISNKEKDKITSSTQSYKLTLSNLFNGGAPIDFKSEGAPAPLVWSSMEEDEKRKASRIYDLVSQYVDITTKRINDSIVELEEKIGYDGNNNEYTEIKKLVNVLKEAVLERGSTKNVLNALDIFEQAEKKAIELLPNAGKIEPVMYAIVKNTVGIQKRNGNSVPQVSSLWWDPVDKNRKTENENVGISEELEMYKDGKPYADIMMPLPTKWLNNFMEIYGERDIVKLVDAINRDIENGDFRKFDEDMLFLKGLRIPNQQLSSNDVFRVKKFLVPSNTAMVVVPALISKKVGSDFDIDKLNMYLPHGKTINGKFVYLKDGDFGNNPKLLDMVITAADKFGLLEEVTELTGNDYERAQKFLDSIQEQIQNLDPTIKEDEVKSSLVLGIKGILDRDTKEINKKIEENKLLKAERDIMTHPLNFTNLMKPTDDSQWKNIARNSLKQIRKNWMEKNKEKEEKGEKGEAARGEVYRFFDSLTTKDITTNSTYTASTNVQKTRENIGSKEGVGQVAVSITNHSVNQQYDFKAIVRWVDKDGNPQKLDFPFIENDQGNLANLFSENKELISDLLSGLLTSQVDAVKDPYAYSLGLVGGTLNMACYLIQRGSSFLDVAHFFAQPAIKDFIKQEIIINSEIYSESGYKSVIAKRINEAIEQEAAKIKNEAVKTGFKNKMEKMPLAYKKVYLKYKPYDSYFNTEDAKEFSESLKEMDFSKQIFMLNMFMKIKEQTSDHRTFMSAVNLDTFRPKERAEWLSKLDKMDTAEQRNFVVTFSDIAKKGLMKPYFDLFLKYNQLFGKFYAFENTTKKFILMHEVMDKYLSSDMREKLYRNIPKEFGNFLVQNLTGFMQQYTAANTMFSTKEQPSVTKEFYQKKSDPNQKQYKVFDTLIPMLSYTKYGDLRVDNIRKADLGENIFQLQEYGKEMEELMANDNEFFNRLLAKNFYTYGFTPSILSLDIVMPVKEQIDIFGSDKFITAATLTKEALEKYSKMTPGQRTFLFEKFRERFYLSNPWILDSYQPNSYDPGYNPFYKLEKIAAGNPGIDLYGKYYANGVQKIIKVSSVKTEKEVAVSKVHYYALGGFGFKFYNIDPIVSKGKLTENIIVDANTATLYNAFLGEIKDVPYEVIDETSEQPPVQQQGSVLAQPTTPSVSTGTTGFKGYKGGFENKGKGTPEGDGKDKAMRKIADSAIVELFSNKDSSSKTSLGAVGLPKEGDKVIMLSRNSYLSGKPLRAETKEQIREAALDGAEFIVGDMPGVDSQFIDYLQEIGATFTVYHTGSTPRINVKTTGTTAPNLSDAVQQAENDSIEPCI